ncbi:MAG: ABC transporter ATP-binding protein [Actinomycetes bacterium]|jgi:oligopeptide/dipeptide ABC transporter ATP-binding protein|nr:ABC transporter ATP-binding protein [Actinomycetota bacterium]
MTNTTKKLLQVADLQIGIPHPRRETLVIVNKASFDVGYGEMVGIVGESGSGKTMVCRSMIGTLERRGAKVLAGQVLFEDQDLAHASEATWKKLRGKAIGYVPQSALAGPNPVLTIGAQLSEALKKSDTKGTIAEQSKALLDLVKIRRIDTVMKQYPNQLSGGMRQRVMIACALASSPKLLIADEPTTGLDVTVQAQIMVLLKEIRNDFGTAIILISHDLALIDDVCDRVVVMHAGATVEVGSVAEMTSPRHPYTVALNQSRIDIAVPGSELVTILGNAPSVGQWPDGCRFAGRCTIVQNDCTSGDHPPLFGDRGAHQSACLHADLLKGR